jgi:hypothetical protein
MYSEITVAVHTFGKPEDVFPYIGRLSSYVPYMVSFC